MFFPVVVPIYRLHHVIELQKEARQHEDLTLQDMYNYQDGVDDDEDDSDWEPLQKPTSVVTWFCVNCTMVNFEDVVHCDVWSLNICFLLLVLFDTFDQCHMQWVLCILK